MRERITYIHEDDSLNPASLNIQEAGLIGPQVLTTRQDRFTIPFDELPLELAELLRGFDGLHIRWASPLQYQTLDPITSRISPGIHVSYSPSHANENDSAKLCGWLQRFGPLACTTPDSFTKSEGDDSSTPPGFYFHQALEDLHSFIATVSTDFCPELDSVCQARSRSLYLAASLDLSFDSASKSLQIGAVWPLRTQTITAPASDGRRTEVGIFMKDTPQSGKPHELGAAGVTVVLQDKKKPAPTVFKFPSRHRLNNGDFTSKFLTPTGLHPTLQLSLSSSQPPNTEDQCSPYAYLTLPKTIFADRYQLADGLFLASKNLTASRYTSLPVDLEAPAYAVNTWGSRVLLELAPPSGDQDQPWTVEVPLHLRYLEPSSTGETKIEVPYPAVFWACSSEVENLSNNPFDRVHLGFDELFDSKTIFWHVTPRPESGNRLMSSVTVPVLNDKGTEWIGIGTAIAVVLGFAWVLSKLAGATGQSNSHQQAKPAKSAGKKE